MRKAFILLLAMAAGGVLPAAEDILGPGDEIARSRVQDPKQEPKKEGPAQDSGKPQDAEATIVALKGTVDVKRPEDKDWVPAERNMKLKKGSEICTAVASTATLLFGGNIKVDVKALTQAKIEDLAKKGAAVNADVKLKFGSVEVDIQKGDLRADMKVTAPNSTTSVSGSRGIVRAPASAGGGGWITVRAFSGSWDHYVNDLGLSLGLDEGGVANLHGDLARDFAYRFSTDQFTNFFGKSAGELYQDAFTIKGGDAHPGLQGLFEWGSPTYFPAANAFQKPQALPLPPPPPGVP